MISSPGKIAFRFHSENPVLSEVRPKTRDRGSKTGCVTGIIPGDAVGEESIANMITHPQGLFKNAPKGAGRYVFLNQADRLEDLASCRKIGQLVHICQPFFVRSVIIGCAGKKPPIIKVLKA